jgi:hypothetical protein
MTTVNLNTVTTSASSTLATSSGVTSTTAQTQAASTTSVQSATPAPTTTPAVTVTLSANAQRLQTAVTNLAADEASSSTAQLADQWNGDLASSVDLSAEPEADAEVANLPTSDPAHLAQAQAAQAYVKNRVTSKDDPSIYNQVQNPFAGLSQTQLAAIANDNTGLYTGYEKTAALYESVDQTNAWVEQTSNAPQEHDKIFYQAAIQQYNLLSPLQQSVYQPGYLKTLSDEEALQWS